MAVESPFQWLTLGDSIYYLLRWEEGQSSRRNGDWEGECTGDKEREEEEDKSGSKMRGEECKCVDGLSIHTCELSSMSPLSKQTNKFHTLLFPKIKITHINFFKSSNFPRYCWCWTQPYKYHSTVYIIWDIYTWGPDPSIPILDLIQRIFSQWPGYGIGPLAVHAVICLSIKHLHFMPFKTYRQSNLKSNFQFSKILHNNT